MKGESGMHIYISYRKAFVYYYKKRKCNKRYQKSPYHMKIFFDYFNIKLKPKIFIIYQGSHKTYPHNIVLPNKQAQDAYDACS